MLTFLVELALSSCGSWAYLPPQQVESSQTRDRTRESALQGRFLIPGPARKPRLLFFLSEGPAGVLSVASLLSHFLWSLLHLNEAR